MFFTQPAAERRSTAPLDRTIKCWGVIERDLETPWFYVSLRLCEDGVDFGHTLLVADIAQLDALLGQLPDNTSVHSVMMVTPPLMNLSQHWRMERVLRVHTNPIDTSTVLTCRIEIEGGRTYTLNGLDLFRSTGLKPRCIYEETP
ncbi:hypothetical protein [Pseudomonas sp. NPDC089569]|uniref:hypothetical protein n=1 Tax=Pseudomonas sp. NPDC089569 TaxID=3390722 RepID=UPI003D03D4CB